MRVFHDFEKRSIRLTDERQKHIFEHPEMRGMIEEIKETIVSPEKVIQSLSDSEAQLYYRFYIGTRVGNKYLCVVIKIRQEDAFVITAYLTDTVKKGEQIWPRRF